MVEIEGLLASCDAGVTGVYATPSQWCALLCFGEGVGEGSACKSLQERALSLSFSFSHFLCLSFLALLSLSLFSLFAISLARSISLSLSCSVWVQG